VSSRFDLDGVQDTILATTRDTISAVRDTILATARDTVSASMRELAMVRDRLSFGDQIPLWEVQSPGFLCLNAHKDLTLIRD
jgi:hypothetical protein